MKISFKNNKRKDFKKLKQGELFILNIGGCVYMKIKSINGYDCINLHDGVLHSLEDNNIDVIPVEGTLEAIY